MSTPAQNAANRENAKLSTGPKTEAGKAASSQNNFHHGFTGAFRLLANENPDEFAHLLAEFVAEHKPVTATEKTLLERMVQHLWLSRRAMNLQTACSGAPDLALFLRYQTTQDRGFHRCLADLLKLRAERRKAEIGFESQKRRKAEEARKESAEERRRELHPWRVLAAEAEAEHLHMRNSQYDTPDSGRRPRVQRVLAAEVAATVLKQVA